MNIRNIAIAIVAACSIGSCQQKDKYTSLNGEWDVTAIEESVVPDSIEAYIGFDVEKRIIYGYTGCNYITGRIPSEKNETLFGTVASTRRMCPYMATESALLEALAEVHSFKVNNEELDLLDTKGHTLVSLKRR